MTTSLTNKLDAFSVDEFDLDVQVTAYSALRSNGPDIAALNNTINTCQECTSSGGGSGSRVSSCVD